MSPPDEGIVEGQGEVEDLGVVKDQGKVKGQGKVGGLGEGGQGSILLREHLSEIKISITLMQDDCDVVPHREQRKRHNKSILTMY